MNDAPKPEGLRERKRRETSRRIADAGLKAFLANGYDATTLDEIAAAAGISRRTFFHYFKSKDEVLFASLGNHASVVKASILAEPPTGTAIDIARDALLNIIGSFQGSQMMATAKIMRESKTLRSRRHTGYLQLEQAIFEGLCELRPDQARDSLRLVALVTVVALRLAVETWQQQQARHPLAGYVRDAFERLKTEIR
ncbi:TetR family transcriptional regulator [Mesorhizobium sp. M2A.F.Ca.ET.043.05.1.1]|uniref:TetR/AcrR family transcriptional regulator n=1 Tax=Mesorhizobium sp. M2A.F.Ca.ET.043.05.1.1 TaxID=2493671 RepID=UPI000F74D503|nr:TetR/AcrR family transcriptional regulator [Mesorhizobium sp. M2A.F.Ca.ET.043.05.1.1]AZO17031.1 TetR family transcriptional regulator [Mesorhizobium sp. M2A.F.Ca.ET.043.05.1.1]